MTICRRPHARPTGINLPPDRCINNAVCSLWYIDIDRYFRGQNTTVPVCRKPMFWRGQKTTMPYVL